MEKASSPWGTLKIISDLVGSIDTFYQCQTIRQFNFFVHFWTTLVPENSELSVSLTIKTIQNFSSSAVVIKVKLRTKHSVALMSKSVDLKKKNL